MNRRRLVMVTAWVLTGMRTNAIMAVVFAFTACLLPAVAEAGAGAEAEPGQAAAELTGRIELTLADALHHPRHERGGEGLRPIHLEVEVVAGRWRSVAGRAPLYNIAAHEGEVISAGLEGDQIEMRLAMRIRPDPWIGGGTAVWDLALERNGDRLTGHWAGRSLGEYGRGGVTGRILPLVVADRKVPRIDLGARPGAAPSPPAPIRIIAPRNAAGSGMVVLTSPRPLLTLRTQVSELRHRDGRGSIPAEAVALRYATMIEGAPSGRYYDALHPSPPEGAHTVPVWVTVRTCPTMAPGGYEGTLTIQLEGADSIEVPIELTLGAWVGPEPGHFTTHVGLMQSPESVAYRYGVEPWSDRHFELLEPSLALLAGIGGDVLYVTAIRQTHLGNEHAMVRFRENARGEMEPDLSIVRRYLELYARHGGRPNAVVVYLWEPDLRRGWRPAEALITRSDAAGRAEPGRMPFYDLDAATQRPWKAMMDGIYKLIDRLEWDGDTVLLGTGSDWRPDGLTLRVLEHIAPEARWALFTHGRGDPVPDADGMRIGRMAVGLYELPWTDAPGDPPRGGAIGGWQFSFLQVSTMRSALPLYAHPMAYRTLPMHTVHGAAPRGRGARGQDFRGRGQDFRGRGRGFRGFGRIGFDFWPLPEGDGARQGAILARYGTYSVFDNNLMRDNPRYITAPGEHGAVATVRYEMLREGVYETEARIFIERALADAAAREQLGDELVERCRRVIAQRAAAFERGRRESWDGYADTDWRGRAAELYNAAGRVQQALER